MSSDSPLPPTEPAHTLPAADATSEATTLIDNAAPQTDGTQLNDRYTVERELGRGGIGVVYLARDRQMMNRQVVIKLLNAKSLENSWTRQKFDQEAEALIRLDHPNIVNVYDRGTTPAGDPFIVMQYLSGDSLRRALSPDGLPFTRAAHILRQLGRALTVVHDAGICHRDLKPENIMLHRRNEAQADDDDDEQVKIIDFGIAKVRNSAVAPSTVLPATGMLAPVGDAEIGITVWRLRRASARSQGDSQGARILAHDAAGEDDVEYTPERIEAETPVAEGERVRISIETPRTGYLYVIDREQYADGSFGDPYLIFPTTRTRGGDNRVAAGQVVELPAQTDTPPYFTLRRSRPEQTSESLTVIVTTEPLPDIRIGRSPLKLTAAQVEGWIKAWSAPFERLELNDGAGQAYTAAEQAAGVNTSRQLTQDEPLPQTIYRIAALPGKPLLITLPLRINQ